jgi:hypothetical protein
VLDLQSPALQAIILGTREARELPAEIYESQFFTTHGAMGF